MIKSINVIKTVEFVWWMHIQYYQRTGNNNIGLQIVYAATKRRPRFINIYRFDHTTTPHRLYPV